MAPLMLQPDITHKFHKCLQSLGAHTLAPLREILMKTLIPAAVAVIVAIVALPSYANAPDPTYDQTRDWVVATISESAGYTRGATTVTYKDVSMDGCQLRFTTTTSAAGYTESDTLAVPLNSVKNIIWGTATDPLRGYVLFTVQAPIRFNRQLISRVVEGQVQDTQAATTVAYIEFGKPGANYADLASHMKAAILRAADVCEIRLAQK
jgi:hypothetical protein